jgi:hypothetical protein
MPWKTRIAILIAIPIGFNAARLLPESSVIGRAEAKVVEATASHLVCPSRSNPSGLKFWIHVKQWCALPGVRGQAQFKLQMQIHNRDQHRSLDIQQSRIRLIVREFNPDHWSPPRFGPPTYDRPIGIAFRGEHVWAVPANADSAYDPNPIPHVPNNLTFATHWGLSSLDPGGTLDPGYHEGDLVFYVPAPHHHGAIQNVVGVAYVKGHEIIALCDPDDWGPKEPAGDF